MSTASQILAKSQSRKDIDTGMFQTLLNAVKAKEIECQKLSDPTDEYSELVFESDTFEKVAAILRREVISTRTPNNIKEICADTVGKMKYQ